MTFALIRQCCTNRALRIETQHNVKHLNAKPVHVRMRHLLSKAVACKAEMENLRETELAAEVKKREYVRI